MTRRYTSTGQPWHAQPMPDRNRTRHDGSRFKPTDKPMSLRECIAWCGFYAGITGLAIAAACGVITGLSPSAEPLRVSSASPHQSLSHGDTK